MNNQFNYATFVELFLVPDEEQESYGVGQPPPPAAREDAVETSLSPLA